MYAFITQGIFLFMLDGMELATFLNAFQNNL